jgi:hypothetical protein
MATVTWTGNALDVKQISTITIANTWATGDTATLTINGKDLVVTVGATDTTTDDVATAIKEAWEGATRLDGTGSTDATSNAGGQEFGEFAEASASVSGSVVTLVARTAGKPFTLTVTESTAGSGTATGATAQAATGKNFWNNADNWDGGSVPANDDIVVFRDSDVKCLYGLPNGSLEVTLQVWMSYTGEVGLPTINRDNPQQPYYEYRQRYVRLDDAGTGTNIAHRFGLGKDGTGFRLFNLKHISLKCSPIVYSTGIPLTERVGTKSLNICCADTTSTLTVHSGSVDCSSQDGGTSAFVNVTVSDGDVRAVAAIHTSGGTVNVDGGNVLVGGSGAIATMNVRSGVLTTENQTGTVTTISVYAAGTVNWKSAATITNLYSYGGTFDARNADSFTITTASLFRGSRFYDPYNRMTVGSAFGLFYDPSPDLQFGANDTVAITIGA